MKTGLICGLSVGFGARVSDAIPRTITGQRIIALTASYNRRKLRLLLLPLVDDRLAFLVPMAIASVDLETKGLDNYVQLRSSDFYTTEVKRTIEMVFEEACDRKYELLSPNDAESLAKAIEAASPEIYGTIFTIPFVDTPEDAENVKEIKAFQVNGAGLSLSQVTLALDGNDNIGCRIFIFKTSTFDRSGCFNPKGIFKH
jgi:hypothetical protein